MKASVTVLPQPDFFFSLPAFAAVELTDRDQNSAIDAELEDAKCRAFCAATTARVLAWYLKNSDALESIYSVSVQL